MKAIRFPFLFYYFSQEAVVVKITNWFKLLEADILAEQN